MDLDLWKCLLSSNRPGLAILRNAGDRLRIDRIVLCWVKITFQQPDLCILVLPESGLSSSYAGAEEPRCQVRHYNFSTVEMQHAMISSQLPNKLINHWHCNALQYCRYIFRYFWFLLTNIFFKIFKNIFSQLLFWGFVTLLSSASLLSCIYHLSVYMPCLYSLKSWIFSLSMRKSLSPP